MIPTVTVYDHLCSSRLHIQITIFVDVDMHGVSDSLTQLTIKGLFHFHMYDIKYRHLKSTVWQGKCNGSVFINTHIHRNTICAFVGKLNYQKYSVCEIVRCLPSSIMGWSWLHRWSRELREVFLILIGQKLYFNLTWVRLEMSITLTTWSDLSNVC